MNLIKNILGRLFAVWALIVFIFTMLVVLIPINISAIWKEPKRSIIMHDVFDGWMTLFFILTGVRRIFKGKEHFKKGQNYVVVCNHVSFMDVPLTSVGVPGPNKTIAKIEMARIPLFNMVYKRGSVLVDRKNEKSRRESYMKMKEVLNWGLHMSIYPEGTRNKTKEPLTRFHDGAFKLAIDCQKPVMPSLVFYTNKVLPRNKKFYFWPHHVEMHFLPPVSSENKTTQQLKDEVFQVMKEYYVQHNKG
jgi:1-acyl-sn-glycerol-3-phosphate acyltransferase